MTLCTICTTLASKPWGTVKIYDVIVEPGRKEHIARHHIGVEEAHEIIEGDPSVTHKRQGRYRLIGQTVAGRYLTVIIAPRGPAIYGLVIARDADENERRNYLNHRGR